MIVAATVDTSGTGLLLMGGVFRVYQNLSTFHHKYRAVPGYTAKEQIIPFNATYSTIITFFLHG
jgi:hypothetical protein